MQDKKIQDIEYVSPAITGYESFLVELVNQIQRLQISDLSKYILTKFVSSEEFINKVNKEEGKSLSSNDFTNQYKLQLDNLASNLDDKVSKEEGKQLSDRNFTAEYKDKLDTLDILLANKVNVDSNKVLSTNDFTNDEKTKLSTIQDNAQTNIIENIKINGIGLEIIDKVVDILISSGQENGTISVQGIDIAIKGLAALAYKNNISEEDLSDSIKNSISNKASQEDLTTLTSQLSVLTGTGDGSIQKIVDDAFNAFVSNQGDGDDVIDSYAELVRWANSEGDTVTQLINDVGRLNNLTNGIGGENQPMNVLTAISDAITALNINQYVVKENDKVLSSNDFTNEDKEALGNKVDKEYGKGLSTNDFTNEDKEALGNKVDKDGDKVLSTNDFTNDYKEKLDSLSNYDDSNLANLYLAKAGGAMDSTNKVNNLNADLLDGKEADEFVEKTGSVMTGPLSFTTGINEAYKKNGLIFIKDNATEQARVGTDDSGIFGMYNVGDYIALRPGFDFVNPNTNVGLEIYQNKMIIGGVILPTFVKLTETEYNAIEVKDPNTIYFMTE